MRERLGYVGLLARLVVGGVWLWAGLLKLPHLESSVTAVRGYQLLPLGSTETVGRLLPLVEVVVGVLLILGVFTRVVGGVSALMQLAFIIGIASVWSRGIAINCGCFGDGGANPDAFSKYPYEIARDVGLMALSLFLLWRPRSPLALDNLLFPARTATPEPAPDQHEESHVHERS